jgi:uncharacterized protein YjbI with pentapeptide repeats
MKNSVDKSLNTARSFRRRPIEKTELLKLHRKIRRKSLLFAIGIVALVAIVFIAWQSIPDELLPEYQRDLITLFVFLGIFIGFLIWKIPQWQLAPWKKRLEVRDLISLEINARTTLIQMIGGLALLGGLYYTKENIETTRESATNTANLIKEGRDAERLNKAMEWLASDKMDVRLGGILSLERIAQKSDTEYWTIMVLLTSYVRLNSPWPPRPQDTADEKPKEPICGGVDLEKPICRDIQAILNVLANRRTKLVNGGPIEGEDIPLDLHSTDLRGARLENANLEKAILDGAYLKEAKLMGAKLKGASMSKAILDNAILQEAVLELADCNEAHFTYADLSGSNLKNAILTGAVLDHAKLNKADLCGANLSTAYLTGTYFNGADLYGAVGLDKEWLEKARSGYLIDVETTLPQGLNSGGRRFDIQVDRYDSRSSALAASHSMIFKSKMPFLCVRLPRRIYDDDAADRV